MHKYIGVELKILDIIVIIETKYRQKFKFYAICTRIIIILEILTETGLLGFL